MTHEPLVLLERLEARWLDAAASCLSAAEEDRAARFRLPDQRHTWRAGRCWVRHQLGEALGIAPVSIVFETDGRGRPRVAGAPRGFDCNWSHSGPWIALAIGGHGPVGIDIEVVRPDFPVHDVETTVCTPAECAALAAPGQNPSRTRLFFRLWTAKEALMKATGLGAALDPSVIEVRLRDGHASGYASHPSWLVGNREGSDWVASWTWGEQPS